MENLGISSPSNFNSYNQSNKHDKNEMKINSYQTTSEFYNPNNRENASKNESRNGKQTASSLPKVAHSKKQNYVSDNDYSMDMMIDDEEFETKKINDQKDPKIVHIKKKNKLE